MEVCRVKEPDKPKPEGQVNYPEKHRIIRVYRLDEDGNEINLDGEEEVLEMDEETDTPRKKRRTSEPI